jgi:hypothetical protein
MAMRVGTADPSRRLAQVRAAGHDAISLLHLHKVYILTDGRRIMTAHRIGSVIGVLLGLTIVSTLLSLILSRFSFSGGAWSWLLLGQTAGGVCVAALLRWLWNRRHHVESIA